MDAEKRKGRDDGNRDVKRSKADRVNEAMQAVTEDEVEEFYAILRRIHVAIKYFNKGDSDGKRWRPSSVEKEALGEASSGVPGGSRVGEDSGLDLNSDPV